MTDASRPLRAVGVVLGGWILARTAILMTAAPAVAQNDGLQPVRPDRLQVVAHERARAEQNAPYNIIGIGSATATATLAVVIVTPAVPNRHILVPPNVLLSSPPASVAPVPKTMQLTQAPGFPSEPGAVAIGQVSPSAAHNRFQLSIWSLVRDAGSSGSLVPGGTLGGSQIGARGWFEPGPKGLALTARISSPLASRNGSEASIGVGFRKGNFGVILEERFSLDAGGGARPSVTAFGGASEVRLRGKLRLDAYAQAGVVGLRNRVGFADGAVRVEHPLVGKSARLSVGAGAWGGAQPGLSRLDIGPQVVARLPVFSGNLRVAGEWRFRVAGNADPGSGPTLSIGADF